MELNQLRQLRNLNVELLETTLQLLHFIDDYCIKNGIPLPSEKSLMNLVQHALGIIAEINADVALPPSVQHLFQTPSNEADSSIRRFFTDSESDADLTEPFYI